ncbi:solute carrier family 15 member 4-like [Actinia tenebrosa]|uniref:Solute carrier family 15 member 4-like n=1 Tax=Actinia tenebrosa TaxID=6105 RepID=A0A6P8IEI3_ACTTE|nr:solute carrier family 15 member 4-like [Actinia tenebrosa]XP_031564280.1 solute carrier family 15 member 4-like [Actinia tenebrosa]
MDNSENSNCAVMNDDDQLAPLIRGNSSSVSTSTGTSSTKTPRTHLPGKPSKIHVTLCILITELCERLTFYGITANLVPFCHDMLNLATPLPSTINLVFQGTCYLIPVVGGLLADSYMGRFNVIYSSSLIYVVGTLLLATVSLTDDSYSKHFGESQVMGNIARQIYFALALFFLALGTGGIKANVSPFGADQVREEGPGAIQRFFNWFYWFINIGSFVSFTLVVWIQQEESFFLGYTITACSMFLGVLTFLIGRNSYIVHPPGGSNLADSFKVIGLAIKRKMKNIPKIKGESWLDLAKDSRGGRFSATQVDDVKSLLRILPVFAMFVIYWTLYSQMQTSYLIQAQYMKINLGFNFNLPAASLSIFDISSVLLLIPFMDKVIYPLLRYIGIKFTPLRRIGVGMIFAAASVAVAGFVEIKRRNCYENGEFITQNLFNKNFNASNMTVFYQVPQFVLIGTSEVFTSITGLEFAYSQAPRCLQGLVMGIFLVTSGLGNFLSSALTNIVYSIDKKWYPEDPNNGNLEYYFFLLSGLMFVNFLIFILVALNYKYVDHRRARKNVIPQNWDNSQSNSKSLEA